MGDETFIRVLGPLEIVHDGHPVPMNSRHQRALLGVLVIAGGHLVPITRLENAIWGDRPPPSAEASLHSYVSRVRHLLGHDLIEREDHSYRLAVTRSQIDALRFEDLLAEAEAVRDDPDACLRRCRQALALWRGDPFGDLADDVPFRLEAMRLDELRVATMELALECELALGHAATVAAELESAVEEYPYRERLWYLLMDALEHEDRRVEALRAGQRLRAVLAEAGLDPGDELRRLEERILTGAGAPPAEQASEVPTRQP